MLAKALEDRRRPPHFLSFCKNVILWDLEGRGPVDGFQDSCFYARGCVSREVAARDPSKGFDSEQEPLITTLNQIQQLKAPRKMSRCDGHNQGEVRFN